LFLFFAFHASQIFPTPKAIQKYAESYRSLSFYGPRPTDRDKIRSPFKVSLPDILSFQYYLRNSIRNEKIALRLALKNADCDAQSSKRPV
jgi:hypothetical protein